MKILLSAVALGCLPFLGMQGGMGPGPGTAHSTGLNPCLISAWPMNEGSGLTLHDSTSNTNTATLNSSGAVTWQTNTGLPGTTPLWSGTGNAQTTNTSLLNFTGGNPFSVGFWVKTTSTGQMAIVGNLNTASGYKGWEVAIGAFGHVGAFSMLLINSYPSNYASYWTNSPINDGNLHYVVATYDGSGSSAGMLSFVDGANVAFSTGGVGTTVSASTANSLNTWIGVRRDSSTALTGALAFVEVYNCALTSTQIAANYAAGPGIY